MKQEYFMGLPIHYYKGTAYTSCPPEVAKMAMQIQREMREEAIREKSEKASEAIRKGKFIVLKEHLRQIKSRIGLK